MTADRSSLAPASGARPHPRVLCRRLSLLGVTLTVTTLVALAGCGPGADPADAADLVLLNGKVATVDPALGETEAVAVRGNEIQAVGTTAEIRQLVGTDTEVIDLDGRLAIPGFIEGHGHYLGLGNARLTLDLARTTSWDEIVALVAEAVENTEPGQWITGRGWHQERWDPMPEVTYDGVATHHELSAVSPDNPVLLTHASGHGSFANARAMQEAGITRDTPDPSGGTIVRDSDGEATGFLRQAAQSIARRAQSRADDGLTADDRHQRFLRQVELAGAESLAHGVTSFHDAGSNFATIDRLRELAEAGELPVRLYIMVRGESNAVMDERLGDYLIEGAGGHFLTVRSIKRAIDGALGTHGAWLLEPYADMPETSGLPQTAPEQLRQTAEIALRHGFQLNTHAIGDRGNRETLDVYEGVLAGSGGVTSDHRWRVEHAQHLHPEDIARFAELGVIASMQGIHGTSDGPWVEPRLGEERARTGAYVWRDLIDSGAVICNGTDVPVEPISAVEAYHASGSRMTRTGDKFFEEQAMTRMEALESYTINCAYAAFMDDVLGTLTPGKLADITVLDRDILTIPEEEIPETQVDITIVDGEVRYRR